MPFWSAYRKIGEPVIIEGISVRFISQIPLKENEKPSKYVQKVHMPLNGLDIASQRNKSLYELANIRASNCCHGTLKVVPDPILPNNPNHANVVGYPTSKEDQMAIAKVLAASIEGKWQSPPGKS